jgi:hypothetical protein
VARPKDESIELETLDPSPTAYAPTAQPRSVFTGNKRQCFAIAGALLLGAALGISVTHAVERHGSTTRRAGAVTVTTTTSMTPGKRPPGFFGTWTRHSTYLTILRNGVATLEWRLYRECGVDPPPCDLSVGNAWYNGGRATLYIRPTGRRTAVVTVTSSTDLHALPLGATRAWLNARADLLYLVPFPGAAYPFCAPGASYGACGA